jgi:hypothetical protein
MRLQVVLTEIRELMEIFKTQKQAMMEFYRDNPELRVTAFDIVNTIQI